MPNYQCNHCNKTFNKKGHMDYHVQHKSCKITRYHCKHCNKGFTTDSSMYRHMKNSCKLKDTNDQDYVYKDDTDRIEMQRIYEELLCNQVKMQGIIREMDELKKENHDLKRLMNSTPREMINNNTSNTSNNTSNTSNNTINGDVNINTNIVNNNYVLVGYGKENLSKVDRNDLLKGIQTGFNSTLNLIDTVHFNPKYPEFHNVYISSMKNKYAMIYDGRDWNLMMKDDLIDKLYDDKRNYIEENLDEFLDSLSKSQINALHRWLDVDDDHRYVKKIKNDIKLLLYNKRRLALNSKSMTHDGIEFTDLDNIDDNDDNDNIYDNNVKVIKAPKKQYYHDNMSSSGGHMLAGRPGTKRKLVRKV
jgi:hypothetical protein